MKRGAVLLLFIPLIILAFLFLLLKFTLTAIFLPNKAWNYLVALDKFMNVILDGDENMTISARAGMRKDELLMACILCKTLHVFDRNHCEKELFKYNNKKNNIQ